MKWRLHFAKRRRKRRPRGAADDGDNDDLSPHKRRHSRVNERLADFYCCGDKEIEFPAPSRIPLRRYYTLCTKPIKSCGGAKFRLSNYIAEGVKFGPRELLALLIRLYGRSPGARRLVKTSLCSSFFFSREVSAHVSERASGRVICF